MSSCLHKTTQVNTLIIVIPLLVSSKIESHNVVIFESEQFVGIVGEKRTSPLYVKKGFRIMIINNKISASMIDVTITSFLNLLKGFRYFFVSLLTIASFSMIIVGFLGL